MGRGRITAAHAAEALMADRPPQIGPEEYERRLGAILAGWWTSRRVRRSCGETLALVRADLEARLTVVETVRTSIARWRSGQRR